MTIDEIIEGILLREGDFVDNPDDPGGATRWGITERTARTYGYEGPMSELPRDVARDIYLEKYYFKPGFDRIFDVSPKVAEELTDTGVNVSPRKAVRMLQDVLNSFNRRAADYPDLLVDGYLGEKSLEALRAYLTKRAHQDGLLVLLRTLNAAQIEYYRQLGKKNDRFETFMYGWIRARGA